MFCCNKENPNFPAHRLINFPVPPILENKNSSIPQKRFLSLLSSLSLSIDCSFSSKF